MPALTSITVNDRETTPVAHVFSPFSKDANGVATLKESDGVPIGDNIITVSMRKTGDKYKCRLRVTMPVVVDETINGIVSPRIARTAYADVQFTFADSSTTQERMNMLGIVSNMFKGTTAVDLIDGVCVDLEDAY